MHLPQPVIVLPDLTSRADPPSAPSPPDVIYVDGPPSTTDVTVHVKTDDEQVPFINHADATGNDVADWDSYIGQEAVKAELRIMMRDASEDCEALPHTLLASGLPGVGKTTLAHLISKEMGGKLHAMVPPFSRDTLNEALLDMSDFDILFIDEIHKLADNGPAMAENLLTAMEEGKLYINGLVHKLPEITIIGATTDAGRLPRAIRSRFMIKPFFERYTIMELARIVETNFEAKICAPRRIVLTPELRVAIATACRWTPRVARELVLAAKALINDKGRMVTPEELLAFKRTEPDGTTRGHIQYVTTLFKIGRNETADGTIEYRAGEATMLMALDEDRDGLAELERWLIEIGLVDKTPRGRRLTPSGVKKATEWLARGERLPK